MSAQNVIDVNNMKINEKYLEALKAINGWTTVSAWAIKFGEMFPDMLEKAHKEALNHKKPSTGLRELAARISSWVSTDGFEGLVEIDDSERPRKVRYLSSDQKAELIEKEIIEDTEPFTRSEKIKNDMAGLSTKDRYRIDEMENISASLNSFFRLDFEVDHAQAILNNGNPGKHHPTNLQILLKSHNRMKSSSNWKRFTLEEQIEYIKAAVRVQEIVAKKMEIDLEEQVIGSIIERLKLVF